VAKHLPDGGAVDERALVGLGRDRREAPEHVWTMMFHTQLGVLNYLLSLVGIPAQLWVFHPATGTGTG
jgi:hypothetical protein